MFLCAYDTCNHCFIAIVNVSHVLGWKVCAAQSIKKTTHSRKGINLDCSHFNATRSTYSWIWRFSMGVHFASGFQLNYLHSLYSLDGNRSVVLYYSLQDDLLVPLLCARVGNTSLWRLPLKIAFGVRSPESCHIGEGNGRVLLISAEEKGRGPRYSLKQKRRQPSVAVRYQPNDRWIDQNSQHLWKKHRHKQKIRPIGLFKVKSGKEKDRRDSFCDPTQQ